MREDLLQYIWQSQRFAKEKLVTCLGEELRVLHEGESNADAGPDFLRACVEIGGVKLYGHVEVHVKGSTWYTHCHEEDPAYKNVILHVVWEDDKPVYIGGERVPTLSLSSLIKEGALEAYRRAMKHYALWPYAVHLHRLSPACWQAMVEKAFFVRLREKCRRVYALFLKNNKDTEVTAYQLLAYGFGFKLNSEAFLALSERVPWRVVRNNANSILAIEALFLGQAGFLEGASTDDEGYVRALRGCYRSLKRKYGLKSPLSKVAWKFSRCRPANFPTLRIVQFAQLLHRQTSVFCFLMNGVLGELQERLRLRPSAYWHTHYGIGKSSKGQVPGMGKGAINTLIVNTVVPLLVSYGRLRGEGFYVDRAIALLKNLPPEVNRVTGMWKALGKTFRNSFDSQGGLALFKHFGRGQRKRVLLAGGGLEAFER